jgi:acetyltransferase
LPAAPDLALICTPPHTVAGLIGEPGALGTRAVVIVTAGRVRWYMPDPS